MIKKIIITLLVILTIFIGADSAGNNSSSVISGTADNIIIELSGVNG